jgi:hypothetical protein
MYIFKFLNTIILFLIIPGHGSNPRAQNDHVVQNETRTVLFHRMGWEMSYPVIDLNSTDQLSLKFDYVGDDSPVFTYKIVHCNAEWEASDMLFSDYMSGFAENEISDYQYSSGTLVSYVHYRLELPNDDVGIREPGNYKLVVFRDYNAYDTAFVRKFYVYEEKCAIFPNVKAPDLIDKRKTHQEVDFRIDFGSHRVDDPYRDIYVVISQNGRMHDAVKGLKPNFFHDGVAHYDYDYGNLFPGYNEFRYFDAKDVKFNELETERVFFDRPYYTFQLKPDEKRRFLRYQALDDINGHYVVRYKNNDQSHTNADYVRVSFTMPMDAPLAGGKVAVSGEMTDWGRQERAVMAYDYQDRAYKCDLILKQGYYNYMYAFLPDTGDGLPDYRYFEGSHYQTENNYLIFVYHRNPRERADRLIGFKIVNTAGRAPE